MYSERGKIIYDKFNWDHKNVCNLEWPNWSDQLSSEYSFCVLGNFRCDWMIIKSWRNIANTRRLCRPIFECEPTVYHSRDSSLDPFFGKKREKKPKNLLLRSQLCPYLTFVRGFLKSAHCLFGFRSGLFWLRSLGINVS